MADGTISVDLQLLLDNLAQQSKAAAVIIKKNLGADMGVGTEKVAADTNKATAAQEKLATAAQKTTKALTEQQRQLAEWRKLHAGGVAPDQKIISAEQPAGKPSAEQPAGKPVTGNPLQAQADAWKGSLATAAAATQSFTKKIIPLTPPGYKRVGDAQRIINMKPALPNVAFPALPKTTPAGTSKHSQTINGTLIRSLVGSIAGSALAGPIGAGLGASYSGASAKFSIAIAAATAGLKLLRQGIMETFAAIERARSLYAKTMQSGGLGQGFVVRQNILASVLGVSEQDVMQYGLQIGYLNQQLVFATKTITESIRPLTQVSWGFKVMGENMKALWAQIAGALAPALNAFTDDFNKFLTVLGESEVLKAAAGLLGGIMTELNDVVGIIEVIADAFVVGLKIIADGISIFIMETLNLLAKIPGLKKLGGWDTSVPAKDAAKNAQNLADLAQKVWDNKAGKGTEGMPPPPQANIARMPSSAWEKMGMVIGMGGRTDHAAVTAKGVTRLVALTEKMFQQRNNINHDLFANPMAAMA